MDIRGANPATQGFLRGISLAAFVSIWFPYTWTLQLTEKALMARAFSQHCFHPLFSASLNWDLVSLNAHVRWKIPINITSFIPDCIVPQTTLSLLAPCMDALSSETEDFCGMFFSPFFCFLQHGPARELGYLRAIAWQSHHRIHSRQSSPCPFWYDGRGASRSSIAINKITVVWDGPQFRKGRQLHVGLRWVRLACTRMWPIWPCQNW